MLHLSKNKKAWVTIDWLLFFLKRVSCVAILSNTMSWLCEINEPIIVFLRQSRRLLIQNRQIVHLMHTAYTMRSDNRQGLGAVKPRNFFLGWSIVIVYGLFLFLEVERVVSIKSHNICFHS